MSLAVRRRLTLAGVLSLAGCSLLPQQPYVQRRDWPLDRAPRSSRCRRGGAARSCWCAACVRRPELEARGLQWLQRDGSVHVDSTSNGRCRRRRRWRMTCGNGWRHAACSAVVAPGSRLNADFVLEGELNAFWPI